MYFFKPISDEVRLSQIIFNKHKKTMKLILVSIFACIAAILQAAGGFLPGIGYFISPLATAPILLCSMFSIPFGVMSYLLTIMLLFILQPTELIVFPFTTGLLGLGIGASFSFFKEEIKYYCYWCHSFNVRNYESTIYFSLSGFRSSRLCFLFISYNWLFICFHL